LREHKKVNAGTQVFQTYIVYDLERIEIWPNELAKRNILDEGFIMVGITPIRGLKMASCMIGARVNSYRNRS